MSWNCWRAWLINLVYCSTNQQSCSAMPEQETTTNANFYFQVCNLNISQFNWVQKIVAYLYWRLCSAFLYVSTSWIKIYIHTSQCSECFWHEDKKISFLHLRFFSNYCISFNIRIIFVSKNTRCIVFIFSRKSTEM